jgi:hypothetical protein
MRHNQSIYLLKTENQKDIITGRSVLTLISYKKILGQGSPVGSYTNWNAHSSNVELETTLQIRARVFSNEKYVYTLHHGEYKLFLIENVGKGERPELIRLNCSESKEDKLKEAIEDELSN